MNLLQSLLVLLLSVPFICAQDVKVTKTIELGDFVKAIAQVESGGDDNAVGDNGKSLGRFQIQKAYWKDAVDHQKHLKVNRKWEDVKYADYAEQVMLAYFDRYAAEKVKEKDWEYLARIHNGGPGIHKKPKTGKAWANTTAYWEKVKKELDK